MDSKAIYRRWVESGWEDVIRDIPEKIVVDFEPEVDRDKGITPVVIWNDDPLFYTFPNLPQEQQKQPIAGA